MKTRRRVLSILAGAAALPAVGRAQASTNLTFWRGIALGAEARIILDHPDADRLVQLAVNEIRRLEKIFSLYRPDSQISRLNRGGVLVDPAFEMVELLSICSRLNARTNGAFDPTVQTLWALYASSYSDGSAPEAWQIAQALESTGWGYVTYSAGQVSFGRAGVAMTLNGIAQGYIADKVTAILAANGVQNVLVNTGEISALGTAPDGGRWPVELAGRAGHEIMLGNGAIATSAPLGTTFDKAESAGHIIDPRTGMIGGNWTQVSVITKSAAQADGLSTAFCLMTESEIDAAKGAVEVHLS